MFLLAKFLDKNKFQPILAVSNFRELDSWCHNFEKEEISVIRLDVKHKHDPNHYFQLKKIIKKHQIDILHAHVWNPASCRYAYMAAKSCKIPLVTTEHDPFKLPAFKNLFKRRSLKNVTKIITVSDENKEILAQLYPKHKEKITIIHNGIDTTWWQSQLRPINENDIRKVKKEVFYANEDSLIIISIATLHERKGLKFLIEAVERLVEKFNNVKLVIIGEGPEKAILEKQIKHSKLERHVALLGKKKEIPKLLKSSNIFVLPSLREAFGLVNLEAMITPLPVVASKTGGIPEIVQHNKTGILTEPGNSDKLTSALEKLIQEPELREKFAQEGKKRVLGHFSAEKMAEKYEEIYTGIH